MTKHKVGTRFVKTYVPRGADKEQKIVVKVMKGGYYVSINGKQIKAKTDSDLFPSFSAAVKSFTTTPASVFFKTSGKSAAKTARKTRKGKVAQVEQAHSLSDMIREMVKKEIGSVQDTIREEVRSAVNGAISDGFRGEFGAQ